MLSFLFIFAMVVFNPIATFYLVFTSVQKILFFVTQMVALKIKSYAFSIVLQLALCLGWSYGTFYFWMNGLSHFGII